ncbi:hypothetical protein HPB51_027142 [Rhipicephalus microplus]|uniref:Uncharacterized protein n=1 Tax=Rhipicephalus microplus TaxID=6941 RepID=A0A9J6D137_RHIMP|nr:hypothetical protein HPB51_027142 [Rhipicephalus microplus]
MAVGKLRNVRTVLWPSKKFLAANVLEEVYKSFPGYASSFTKFWIETRRSQRQLFGSEAAAEELVLGDNAKLPYVNYVDMLNRLSLSLGALAPPLYYPDGTNAMLHGVDGGEGVLYHRLPLQLLHDSSRQSLRRRLQQGSDELRPIREGLRLPRGFQDEPSDQVFLLRLNARHLR